MSYDLSVAVKVEGCDKYAVIRCPEFANPTYNLADMFRACMEWDYELDEYYPAERYVRVLETGIKELYTHQAAYEQYLPENGWGTFKGAIESLESWRSCIYECAEEIPIECLYICWG